MHRCLCACAGACAHAEPRACLRVHLHTKFPQARFMGASVCGQLGRSQHITRAVLLLTVWCLHALSPWPPPCAHMRVGVCNGPLRRKSGCMLRTCMKWGSGGCSKTVFGLLGCDQSKQARGFYRNPVTQIGRCCMAYMAISTGTPGHNPGHHLDYDGSGEI